MYKITIIGYRKSGKTSIINKYLEGKEFNKPSDSIAIFGFHLKEEILVFKYVNIQLLIMV